MRWYPEGASLALKPTYVCLYISVVALDKVLHLLDLVSHSGSGQVYTTCGKVIIPQDDRHRTPLENDLQDCMQAVLYNIT